MAIKTKPELLRQLPSVDELLREPPIAALAAASGHAAVAEAARAVLARLREEIVAGHLDGKGVEMALVGLAAAVERELHASTQPSLRAVVNATGVILHTNLGRAPLAAAVFERMRDGKEIVLKPGDLFYVKPGHDSWVVGDEPYVSIHFLGAGQYAK